MNTESDTLLDASRTRFNLNMGRVQNLVTIFEGLGQDNAKSRDVLRAAVMLLHASLEDALRQLLLYRMPNAPIDLLTRFFSDRRDPRNPKPDKMNVGELAKLHTVEVEHEIRSRMGSKLANSNYNDGPEVIDVLITLGFNKTDVEGRIGKLGEMMTRRHAIVHRSDREEANVVARGRKKSHGLPRKIDTATVNGWLEDVQSLMQYVINNIDDPPRPKKDIGRRTRPR